MTISVCISDGGDDRLARTLSSLSSQDVDEILVEKRGTVAGSRNQMYRESTGDVLAFVDTDQEVPPTWVEELSKPLREGRADFACGPTRPHPISRCRYSEYHTEIERRHYVRCRDDQTVFPMGNSMWERYVLEAVASSRSTRGDRLEEGRPPAGRRKVDRGSERGSTEDVDAPFDERFTTGGEDYDVNLRATKLG